MSETKEVKTPTPAPLARASEATDPVIHQLAAQRHILVMNIAAAQADLATIADAEERLTAINEQLADLGYE